MQIAPKKIWKLASTLLVNFPTRQSLSLSIRVFLKMKNPFLWAGLRNPIVSVYKKPKYQFSDFLDTYWLLAP